MNKQIRILLVEDNEGDILLTIEAFRQADVESNVNVVRDGEEALQFLYKQDGFKDAETPHLIFLDINLPKIDGKEVLRRIKNDAQMKKIPVIMLTTSDFEEDIQECYDNFANCYITKPVDLRIFFEIIGTVKQFWINHVHLSGVI